MIKLCKVLMIFVICLGVGYAVQLAVKQSPIEMTSQRNVYAFCESYVLAHDGAVCHVDTDIHLANLADTLTIEQAKDVCNKAAKLIEENKNKVDFTKWKLNIFSYDLLSSRPIVECNLSY
jgi:hypothetical protein